MTSIVKTIRIKSDVRPDLDYMIIDADDFDPKTQVLWTEEQKPDDSADVPPSEQKLDNSADVPPVEQKPKSKVKRTPVVEGTGETEEDAATPLS